MTAPSPATLRTCYIGQADAFASGSDALSEVADCLALPFKPLGVFWQVETAVDVAVLATFTWNPNPASATGAVAIATWTQPVQIADTCGVVFFNKNDDTSGTSIGSGGPTSAYGIDGSVRFAGEVDKICGPGGELSIVVASGAATGVVEYWLIYEVLSMNNQVSDATVTVVTATTA